MSYNLRYITLYIVCVYIYIHTKDVRYIYIYICNGHKARQMKVTDMCASRYLGHIKGHLREGGRKNYPEPL